MSLVDSFEKIPVKIFENDKMASAFVAREIANLIKHKQQEGKNLCTWTRNWIHP